LRALFVALNDEAVAVRSLAVGVVGRLAAFNPAHVLPALRRHLMQLLNDMDHSPDSRQREGAALPGCLRLLVSHALLGRRCSCGDS
jgi:FKBP12-rapamycin complex-associated protein